jgi:dipeptidase D
LVIDKNDKELVEQKFGEYCDMIKSEYKGIEDEITCEVNVIEELPQVINQEERDNIIKFITETIDGVYTMSEDMEDLVESSSNLGIARLDSE